MAVTIEGRSNRAIVVHSDAYDQRRQKKLGLDPSGTRLVSHLAWLSAGSSTTADQGP